MRWETVRRSIRKPTISSPGLEAVRGQDRQQEGEDELLTGDLRGLFGLVSKGASGRESHADEHEDGNDGRAVKDSFHQGERGASDHVDPLHSTSRTAARPPRSRRRDAPSHPFSRSRLPPVFDDQSVDSIEVPYISGGDNETM